MELQDLFNSQGFKNKRILLLLFIIMFTYIIFPSGNVLGINIKMILLFFLFAYVLFGIVNKRFISSKKVVIRISLLFFFIFTFGLYSLINDVQFYSIISAASAWFATFLPLILFIHLIENIDGLREKIINYLILILVIYSLIKTLFFVLQIGKIIDVKLLFSKMYDSFNYSPVIYDYGWFFRINTPVDFLLVPAFLSVFFLSDFFLRDIKYHLKVLIMLSYTSSIVISLSRFLFFYFIMSLLVFSIFTVKFSFKKSAFFIGFTTIWGLIIILIISFDTITGFILERYFGDYAMLSDSVREKLYPELLNSIQENFLLGHGLGAFINGIIFFESAPWNYVLFWLSLLNQFGIVGFTFIFFLFSIPIYFYPINRMKKTKTLKLPRYYIPALISYIIFLLSGFFTTFLLTSSISFLYLMYYLLFSSFLMKEKRSVYS